MFVVVVIVVVMPRKRRRARACVGDDEGRRAGGQAGSRGCCLSWSPCLSGRLISPVRSDYGRVNTDAGRLTKVRAEIECVRVSLSQRRPQLTTKLCMSGSLLDGVVAPHCCAPVRYFPSRRIGCSPLVDWFSFSFSNCSAWCCSIS